MNCCPKVNGCRTVPFDSHAVNSWINAPSSGGGGGGGVIQEAFILENLW